MKEKEKREISPLLPPPRLLRRPRRRCSRLFVIRKREVQQPFVEDYLFALFIITKDLRRVNLLFPLD